MEKYSPKVSIVIPVYNGSNYLSEAIESAIAQTYYNTEIIVVNDGSDDDGKTEAIAKSYGDRIRYFFKENGGVSSALNLGAREMTGDLFSWLSHDDVFAVNRVESDVFLLKEEPNSFVSYCNSMSINSEGKPIGNVKYARKTIESPADYFDVGTIGMCSMTIKRSCFNKTGLFNEKNLTMQDIEMGLLLVKHFNFINNAETVTYCRDHVNRGTYIMKRRHDEDMMNMAKFINNNFTVHEFFPDINLDNDDQGAASYSRLGDLFGYFLAHDLANVYYKIAYNSSKSKSIKLFLKARLGYKYYKNAAKIYRRLMSVKY